MRALLGKKIGMTALWTEDGKYTPVTVLQVGPCYVSQKRASAIQIAFDEVKEKALNKPQKGHQRRLYEKVKKYFRKLADVPSPEKEYEVGDALRVEEVFEKGERVNVRAISKGKGFQGVMKRHGFHGGPDSHGSMFHRRPGSIGATTDPGKVWKGQRMPGRMGFKKVTMRNLLVVDIIPEENLLILKGSTPGPNGSYVYVYTKNPRKEKVGS